MFRESESLALYYNIGIQLKKKYHIFSVHVRNVILAQFVACLKTETTRFHNGLSVLQRYILLQSRSSS